MANENTRAFTTNRGDFTARIFPEKLQKDEEALSAHSKSDRKFNIRIKQDDIYLLDTLANHIGATRSALINEILHEIARDELMSVEDQDARVLLAWIADQSASYDSLAHPWVYDALGSEFRFILENVLKGDEAMTGYPVEMNFPAGHKYTEKDFRSQAYLGLRDKLKGMDK